MTKQEVLAQLGQWEKAQAHDKIVSAILSLPVEQRDYRLSCALAREYNMLGRHQEAKDLLESLAQEGRRDPNWFFHYGFSLHALGRYAEAKGAFQQLLKMVPKQPNILALIHSCDVHLEKQALAKAYSDGLDLDEEIFSLDLDELSVDDGLDEEPSAAGEETETPDGLSQ